MDSSPRKATASPRHTRGTTSAARPFRLGYPIVALACLVALLAADQLELVPLSMGGARIPRLLPGPTSASAELPATPRRQPEPDAEQRAAELLDESEANATERARRAPAAAQRATEESSPTARDSAAAVGAAMTQEAEPDHDGERQRRMRRLCSVLEQMEPKLAAEALQAMPEDRALEFMGAMEEGQLAKVLEAMGSPTRAKFLIRLLE